MPSAGFNIRLSASDVEAVRKALEQVGKSGEGALKQIERSSKSANDQGLKAFNAGLREGQFQLQGYTQRLGPLGSALQSLGPLGLAAGAAIAGVTAGVGALGSAIVGNAREFESLRARLQTVTGSADLAALAFQRITDFAKTTPFEVQNLVTAFTRLKAAGIDPTEERLRAFGDTAAAFGKDITDFADAVVGAITGEGERLKQFGIIARFEADQVRFSFRGASKEVTRDAESIVAALEDIGNTAFAGGMQQQAETLEGVTSNLADAWSIFLDTVDRSFGVAEKAKAGLRLLTEGVEEVAEALDRANPTTRPGALLRRENILESLARAPDSGAAAAVRRGVVGSFLAQQPSQQRATDSTAGLKAELQEINRLLAEQSRRREEAAVLADISARRDREAAAAAKAEAEAKERAEAAAKEAVREQRKFQQDRARALADIEKLEAQAAAAGLEGIAALEHARDVALAEQFDRFRAELIELDEFARARLAIEEKFQKDKADIEAQAREQAERERQREAEKRAAEAKRAADKAQAEAERAAEEQARILQEPLLNAIGNVQDRFTDMFEDVLDGGTNSFEDLADAAKRIFTRLAAEMATLLVFRPSVAGLGGAAAAGGLGGAPAAGLGNFGTLGRLLSFGGGGPVTGVSDSAAAQNLIARRGGFDLGGFLGGAGIGFGAGGLANSIFGGNATGGAIGAGLGSLAGAGITTGVSSIAEALGSFAGPLGGIVGGLFGGILGGLFGPGPSVGPNAVSGVRVVNGRLVGRSGQADNGGDAAGAAQFAAAVADQVNAVLDSLGAGFPGITPFRVGSFGGTFRVGTQYNSGRLDRSLGSDPQQAISGATLFAFERFGLQGIDPALAAAVQRAAQISADLQDFSTNVGLAQRILDDSLFSSDDLSQAEQALKDLNAQFEEAAERAERLGLSVARVEELRQQAIADLTEGFEEGIRAQILAITDPVQGALEAQARAAEQRLREAEALGADLVEVERLNALERQRVLEQAGGDIKRFFEEITFGSLSGIAPAGGIEAQRAAFEAAAASGNVAEVSRLGRGLLESARGAFASGPEFQSVLSRVQEVVGGFVAGNDNGVASAINTGFAESVTIQQQMLNELAALRATTERQQREISRLTSLLESRAA